MIGQEARDLRLAIVTATDLVREKMLEIHVLVNKLATLRTECPRCREKQAP